MMMIPVVEKEGEVLLYGYIGYIDVAGIIRKWLKTILNLVQFIYANN